MFDCDATTVFSESRVQRARKEHQCFECHGLIAVNTKYNYKVGVVLEGTTWNSKRFWEVKICQSCENDWNRLYDIESREAYEAVCICYGELRTGILQAYEEGWLEKYQDLEMYFRWFTPEPEEIEAEPRLLPGGVHPDEAWRLAELPFKG